MGKSLDEDHEEYSGDDEQDDDDITDNDDDESVPTDAIEILDETQTVDQTFASLTEEQFLSMKNNVHEVQQAIQIPVSGIDFESDAKCSKCNGRTFLPKQYFQTDDRGLCNDCLVSGSGHSNCEINQCDICMEIAEEIRRRDEICDLFEKGLLLWQSS